VISQALVWRSAAAKQFPWCDRLERIGFSRRDFAPDSDCRGAGARAAAGSPRDFLENLFDSMDYSVSASIAC
jgi:hypothetical protein